MKKYVFILMGILIFSSCEKDDDGCKCRGEFIFVNEFGSTTAPNVDCETGEPFLSMQNENTDNPVSFIGCED